MTRSSSNGSTTYLAGASQAPPTWLKLARVRQHRDRLRVLERLDLDDGRQHDDFDGVVGLHSASS